MELQDAITYHENEAVKARQSAAHIRDVMHSEIALGNAVEYDNQAANHEQYAAWFKELAAFHKAAGELVSKGGV